MLVKGVVIDIQPVRVAVAVQFLSELHHGSVLTKAAELGALAPRTGTGAARGGEETGCSLKIPFVN